MVRPKQRAGVASLLTPVTPAELHAAESRRLVDAAIKRDELMRRRAAEAERTSDGAFVSAPQPNLSSGRRGTYHGLYTPQQAAIRRQRGRTNSTSGGAGQRRDPRLIRFQATMVMQRVYRGHRGRAAVAHMRRTIATMHLQRLTRGRDGRAGARAHATQLLHDGSARRLQHLWKRRDLYSDAALLQRRREETHRKRYSVISPRPMHGYVPQRVAFPNARVGGIGAMRARVAALGVSNIASGSARIAPRRRMSASVLASVRSSSRRRSAAPLPPSAVAAAAPSALARRAAAPLPPRVVAAATPSLARRAAAPLPPSAAAACRPPAPLPTAPRRTSQTIFAAAFG